MPPLTSVPFGAPTNAPRFKQIVIGHFVQPVNHRHPFGPLLLFGAGHTVKNGPAPQQRGGGERDEGLTTNRAGCIHHQRHPA